MGTHELQVTNGVSTSLDCHVVHCSKFDLFLLQNVGARLFPDPLVSYLDWLMNAL